MSHVWDTVFKALDKAVSAVDMSTLKQVADARYKARHARLNALREAAEKAAIGKLGTIVPKPDSSTAASPAAE
jgi:hypothetical protein